MGKGWNRLGPAFAGAVFLVLAGCGGGGDGDGGSTSEQSSADINTAKAFFAGLRNNATLLKTDAAGSNVTDAVKGFGESLRGEAAKLTVNTVEVAQLNTIALSLWNDYTSGLTSNPTSATIPGSFSVCTVFQGTFPTQFGGAPGAAGQPYSGVATAATSISNARWVGCAVSSGPLLTDGTRRYRQTILLDMSAVGAPETVPYLAITRAQYIDAGVTFHQNLTPTLSGTAGFVMTSGELSGFSLVGDLPPATDAAGNLLAQRYPVNIAGQLSTHSSGALQARFSAGALGIVPVGASEASLTLDLSLGGESVAILPADNTIQAQRDASMINLAVTINSTNGRMKGDLLVDQITVDGQGDLIPGHVVFEGETAVAVSGGEVVLGGTLVATNGSTPTANFSGSLNLPGRPPATLKVSITQTAADSYTLDGQYVQNGVTVEIDGTSTSSGSTLTLSDSNGVSVTLTPDVNTANVTVSGRQTAVVDQAAGTVTYSNGDFETLP